MVQGVKWPADAAVDYRITHEGSGSRRIQSELKRTYDFDVSRPSIEKVLKTMDPRRRLVRPRARKGARRYAKEVPASPASKSEPPVKCSATRIRIQPCWKCPHAPP